MANIPFLNNAYFAAKVGIGVPTPNEMYAGSAEVFRVDEAKLATFKGDAYFNSGLITTIDSTGSFYIDVNANNDYGGRNFRVLNNGTTYFNIDADGKVGIGMTNPSEKLDVQGNIKLRGTNNLTIGSTSNGGNFSLSLLAKS